MGNYNMPENEQPKVIVTGGEWKSRKIWAAFIIFATTTFLLLKGLITAEHWINMSQWIFGGYLLSNLGSKFINGKIQNGTNLK